MGPKDFLNIEFFKFKTNNLTPKKGRLLISDPFANDFFFTRSVVLISEYMPREGAMGFILNKPMAEDDIPAGIIQEFGTDAIHRIYYGGPVGTNQMFYLHKLPNTILNGSIQIIPGLYWGGDYKELANLIKQGAVNFKDVKFFVGYSGWSPGQLESEIKRNSWVIANTQSSEILSDTHNIWREKLKQLGPKYDLWTKYSVNPELN